MRVFLLLFLALSLPSFAQLETRVYTFTNTPPAVVQQLVSEYVPIAHRVRINTERSQVMVIATPQTHAEVAKHLTLLDTPPPRVHLWVRVAESASTFQLLDGAHITIPLTTTPAPDVIDRARERLGGVDAPLHVVALEAHAAILKEDPAAVRLRITPLVLFGDAPPYDTVRYDAIATDLLLKEDGYRSLYRELAANSAYRPFFRRQPDQTRPPEPFEVMLALEGLRRSTGDQTHATAPQP